MTWQERQFKDADNLFRCLVTMSSRGLAWRGQADAAWRLRCSLDRQLARAAPMEYRAKLAEEQSLINAFILRAKPFLSRLEQEFCHHYANQLALCRHYGVPTRAMDWTHSPLAALYFAAVEAADKDGCLWWFEQKPLVDYVHPRWKDWEVPPTEPLNPEGERAWWESALSEHAETWLTMVHHSVPFPRLEAQNGFLLTCSRIGVDHEDWEPFLTGDIPCGRVIVPAELKQQAIERLGALGVNSTSLHYPGADLTGTQIARDFDSKMKCLEA